MCLSSVPMLEAKHCTATKNAGTSTIGTAYGRRYRRPTVGQPLRRRIVGRLPGRTAKVPPPTTKRPMGQLARNSSSYTFTRRRYKPTMPNRHHSHGSWAPHRDPFIRSNHQNRDNAKQENPSTALDQRQAIILAHKTPH
uniref:Uncharacterized protein n=1 Tax=Anopheles maculatus TaxID=74869 RepID=A0A182SQ46_9DIPT